jgi:putative aminopeptidase FrvX
MFGLYSVPSYEKQVSEYMIDALDAYDDIAWIDNWSSYVASVDSTVNPNMFTVRMDKSTDLLAFVEDMQQFAEVKVTPVFMPVRYAVPNDPQANTLWYLQ